MLFWVLHLLRTPLEKYVFRVSRGVGPQTARIIFIDQPSRLLRHAIFELKNQNLVRMIFFRKVEVLKTSF